MTDYQSLKRDPKTVAATFKTLGDGRVVTTTGCKIMIPCRFSERGLAYIGMENYTIGIFAVIVDGVYSTVLINAMMAIDPTSTNKVKFQDTNYYEFVFNKGTTVIKSTKLVRTDILVYRIYDEIFSKGNIPWYLGYNDLAKIYDSAKKHAGTSICDERAVTELIVSILARQSSDKTKYYRSGIQSLADLEKNPPEFVSLRDVVYMPSNTLSKIAGSYMETGIVAALNNPTERTEKIDQILRA